MASSSQSAMMHGMGFQIKTLSKHWREAYADTVLHTVYQALDEHVGVCMCESMGVVVQMCMVYMVCDLSLIVTLVVGVSRRVVMYVFMCESRSVVVQISMFLVCRCGVRVMLAEIAIVVFGLSRWSGVYARSSRVPQAVAAVGKCTIKR
eukprot:1395531-Amorphochlora_amoeboformis.AAC.1